MIPDWETNQLFISDRLETKFPDLVFSLRAALAGSTIITIPGTSGIWCRDYMPIQLDERCFCKFVYTPDYLSGYEYSVTPPDKCRLPFMQDYRQVPIVLDGGNVVASRSKVILTEKVYKENPSINRPQLRKELEQIFQAECIFIPKQAGDYIGHSDGVVRFLSENRVLMNDYSTTDPAYGEGVQKILQKRGLEIEILPMFEEGEGLPCADIPPAVGIYINYLQVGDIVVIPEYERPEDEAALEKMRQVMPDAKISQVPCQSLAEEGGVLNCISWTIKV